MIFFPLKCLLALAIGIVTVQAVGFGHTFSYEEATGGRNMNTEITGVPVLSGMTTSPKKAENLMDLYQYLEDNNLRDRECILFGHIPGIAYYMQLTPAMNIWSDLRSYDCEVMIDDLNKIKEKMQNSKKYPLLIMETSWAQYMNGERQDAIFMDDTALQKLQIIIDFMDRFQYHEVYANEKYVIFIEKSL